MTGLSFFDRVATEDYCTAPSQREKSRGERGGRRLRTCRAMPPTFFCWKDPTCPSLDWYQRTVPDWVRISLIFASSECVFVIRRSSVSQNTGKSGMEVWDCYPHRRPPTVSSSVPHGRCVSHLELIRASSVNLIFLRSLCCAQRINNGSQSDSFPESCCHPSVGTPPPRLSQWSLNSAY